jgi:hypothetical protein
LGDIVRIMKLEGLALMVKSARTLSELRHCGKVRNNMVAA